MNKYANIRPIAVFTNTHKRNLITIINKQNGVDAYIFIYYYIHTQSLTNIIIQSFIHNI